jgi:hypothetical protein
MWLYDGAGTSERRLGNAFSANNSGKARSKVVDERHE